MRRSVLTVALTAMLVLVAGPAGAAPLQRQQAPIVEMEAGGETVGTARLYRSDRTVRAHLRVDDLQPGGTFTVWAMVVNPGETEPDIGFAGGGVVNRSGRLNVTAQLRTGDLTGFPDELGMASGAGLTDARGATIVFVLRSHGPAVPGLVAEQTSTFMGGCDYALVPALTEGTYGAPGAFACADLFTATFEPPVA